MSDAVTEIIREISDTPPWAYTYKERPDDLLEIQQSELEAILRAHMPEASGEVERLRTLLSEIIGVATELEAMTIEGTRGGFRVAKIKAIAQSAWVDALPTIPIR